MRRVFVLCAGILLMATGVYAQTFSTAYKNGASFEERDTFSLGEKPWLHVSVPDTDSYQDWTLSYWNYPTPGSSYFLSNVFTFDAKYEKVGPSDIYLAFNDSTWGAIQKSGDWNISSATVLFKPGAGSYGWTTLQAYSGSTAFKVVPEPVSTSLFLLGGAVLAAKKLRKKNG